MNPFAKHYQSIVQQAAKTKYESRFLAQIREAGFAEPEREYRFHHERKWRFDFAYPSVKLAIEVEGGIWSNGRHTRGYGFEGDCVKYNQAVLLGWRVLRLTPRMVMDGIGIDILLTTDVPRIKEK